MSVEVLGVVALARLVLAAPGPEPGVTYTLMESHPPTLDPQTA